MAGIIGLILADHRRILFMQQALHDADRGCRDGRSGRALASVWDRLAASIEIHADAEEEICYPAMFGTSPRARQQMRDAIAGLDDIREAIGEARLHPVGSAAWRQAVQDASWACEQHSGHQDLRVLADFRRRADRSLRCKLGSQWSAFTRREAARKRPGFTDVNAGPRRAAHPTRPRGHGRGVIQAERRPAKRIRRLPKPGEQRPGILLQPAHPAVVAFGADLPDARRQHRARFGDGPVRRLGHRIVSGAAEPYRPRRLGRLHLCALAEPPRPGVFFGHVPRPPAESSIASAASADGGTWSQIDHAPAAGPLPP
jgi:hypothetical protein